MSGAVLGELARGLDTSQVAGPDMGKMLSLQAFAQQMQEHKQEVQRQNTLRSILGSPGAIDPTTGIPKPATMGAVMAIDPATGMKLQQNVLSMQAQREQLQEHQLKRYGEIQELVTPIRREAMAAYTAAREKGLPEDAANAAGQAVMNDKIPDLIAGGPFSAEEAKNIRRDFNYPQMAAVDKQWQDMQAKQRDEQRKDIQLGLNIKKVDQGTPAQAADRDAMTIANAQISDQNKNLAAAGKPPLNAAEEAEIRQKARLASRSTAPVDDTPMDQEAIDYAATIYRDKGTMPSFGNSRYAVADRKRIINRAAEMAKEAGTGAGGDILKQAGIKADAASLAKTVTYRNQVESFEETAQNSAKLIRELAPKGLGPSGIPAFDSWLQAGRKAVGNADVVKFGNAIDTFTSEYAKIMSGATGAAGSTDSARAKAEGLINKAQNAGQLYGALDVMQREMNIRRQSLIDQEAAIRKEIGGAAGADQSATSGAAAPTETPAKTTPLPDASGKYDLSKTPSADMDATMRDLPKGATFVGPDGKTYRKQ